ARGLTLFDAVRRLEEGLEAPSRIGDRERLERPRLRMDQRRDGAREGCLVAIERRAMHPFRPEAVAALDLLDASVVEERDGAAGMKDVVAGVRIGVEHEPTSVPLKTKRHIVCAQARRSSGDAAHASSNVAPWTSAVVSTRCEECDEKSSGTRTVGSPAWRSAKRDRRSASRR